MNPPIELDEIPNLVLDPSDVLDDSYSIVNAVNDETFTDLGKPLH